MARKIYKFHGGVKVADFKEPSTTTPIGRIPPPEVLIVPLRQHLGIPARSVASIGQYVKKHQMIAKAVAGRLSSTVHAPVSGEIIDIKNHPIIHQSGMDDVCIFIKNDDKYTKVATAGNDDFAKLGKEELFDKIQSAGIVGLGGAGFPSDIKALGGMKNKIETLIINGAECEPYISCDDLLMRERAADIIQGIKIIKKIVEPDKILVAIEDNKPEAIEELKNKNNDNQIEIISIPTIYPSGSERQLIKILTNKEIRAGTIPADIGILCFNVATAFAVYEAVAYAKPLIERVVTITGDKCEKAGNYTVTIGTPISHIADFLGFKPANGIICGGPMMGFKINSLLAPVSKTCNCLLVLGVDFANNVAPSPCIRCGKCAEVCPARLLPQQLYWYCKGKDFANAENYDLVNCIECNCCTHVCPSNIPLVAYYKSAKMQIRNLELKRKKSEHAKIRYENRTARLERLKKERQALRQQQRSAMQKKQNNKAKIIQQAQKRIEQQKNGQ